VDTVTITPGVTFDQLYVALDPADFDANDIMRINRIATVEQIPQNDILLGFRVNVDDGDGDQSPLASAIPAYQEFTVTLDGANVGITNPDIIVA
jgi:hypothetical protein